MRRLSRWFSPLLVTVCCLLTLAGCGTEGSNIDQPDGGLPGDGGADGGEPTGALKVAVDESKSSGILAAEQVAYQALDGGTCSVASMGARGVSLPLTQRDA